MDLKTRFSARRDVIKQSASIMFNFTVRKNTSDEVSGGGIKCMKDHFVNISKSFITKYGHTFTMIDTTTSRK